MHPQRLVEETIANIGPTDHQDMVKLAKKHIKKYTNSVDRDVDQSRMDRILGKIDDKIEYGQKLVGKADAEQERNPRDLTSQPKKVEGERLTRIGKKAIATLDKYQNMIRTRIQNTNNFNRKDLESFDRINRRNPDLDNIDRRGEEAYQRSYQNQAFKNR